LPESYFPYVICHAFERIPPFFIFKFSLYLTELVTDTVKLKEYFSFRDFKEAVKKQAKRRRCQLTADDWGLIEDNFAYFSGAWSSIDVRNALRAIDAPGKKPRPFILGHGLAYQSPGIPSPLDEIALELRAALNIDEPLPLTGLRNWLNLMEEGDHKIRFDYPVFKQDVMGTSLWDIQTIYVDGGNPNTVSIRNILDKISHALKTHPALTLAYLLCNLRIESNDIEFLQNHGAITIQIRNPDRVSPKALMKAYSIARNSLKVKASRRFDIGLAGKKYALHKFILNNPGLSWEEKLRQWNHGIQTMWMPWRYSSVSSMQASYSRIKKHYSQLEKLKKSILSIKK